jgi:hypothetical protein
LLKDFHSFRACWRTSGFGFASFHRDSQSSCFCRNFGKKKWVKIWMFFFRIMFFEKVFLDVLVCHSFDSCFFTFTFNFVVFFWKWYITFNLVFNKKSSGDYFED